MRKEILVIVSVFLMAGIATATEDIIINPETEGPITVGVDPNPIDPPISLTYTGWNTTGGSTWSYEVVNDITTDVICSDSGNINSDPFTVHPTTCKIPASSIGVSHTLTATGSCDRPNCVNPIRSRHLSVDAGLNPVPELSTGILTAVGLIGFVGLVRYRRK